MVWPNMSKEYSEKLTKCTYKGHPVLVGHISSLCDFSSIRILMPEKEMPQGAWLLFTNVSS